MTATTEDTSTLEVIEIEHRMDKEVACDIVLTPCDQPAAWHIRFFHEDDDSLCQTYQCCHYHRRLLTVERWLGKVWLCHTHTRQVDYEALPL